jgi:DNA invertase Pin-like site-specific DNA recombinase
METRPLAYSYCRLSSDPQSRGHGLRRQVEASAKYAAEHDLELVDDPDLHDVGVSAFKGDNLASGGLGRFIAAAQSGRRVPKGSYLLVESLDRISRQEIRKALATFLQIIDTGVRLVTLSDNKIYTAETLDLTDLLVSLVTMSRAHEESAMRSVRVGAAWASKRKAAWASKREAAWATKRKKTATKPLTGRCPGWLRPVYKIIDNRRKVVCFEIIEERAAVVRRILTECADLGLGHFTIARGLNGDEVPTFNGSRGWHPSYVARIVSNPAVIGTFQACKLVDRTRVPDGDPIENYFPSVVSKDLFYRAQDGMRQRLRKGGRKGKGVTNLFGSTLRCAYCQGRMRYITKKEDDRYLVCEGALRGFGCKPARWKARWFETTFLMFVTEAGVDHLLDVDNEGKRIDVERTIAALRGERELLQAQMDKLLEVMSHAGAAASFVGGKLDDLEKRRIAVDREIKLKEQELAGKRSPSQISEDRDRLRALIARLHDGAVGEELYKLRAAIAARLRSVVSAIYVAPLGARPLIDRIAGIVGPAAQDSKLRQLLSHDERHFIVMFAGGNGTRWVFPDSKDPYRVAHQIVGDADAARWLDHAGKVVKTLEEPRYGA